MPSEDRLDVNIGEIWAYRSGGRAALTPVSVEELGDRRAQIQFLAPEKQGATQWVPIGRLRVPWGAQEAFLESEARWDAINGRTRPSLAHREAAWDIFLSTIPTDVAEIYYNNSHGVTEIHDLRRLSDLVGLDPSEIFVEETAFIEDGVMYVPWPATMRIARAVAPKRAGRLLRQIEATEVEQAEQRADANTSKVGWENPATEDEWERRLATWRQTAIERAETVRLWAGAEQPTVAQENAVLRVHLERLIGLAQRASDELPQARTKKASVVKRQLDAAIREIRSDV